MLLLPQRYVFSSKSQRDAGASVKDLGCYCYHKGTYFQANHNYISYLGANVAVVIATTKVRIFKQITTTSVIQMDLPCCYCYHKGTYFQANHNCIILRFFCVIVVIATTKVRIFKQITTNSSICDLMAWLLLLPQRYVFSSKSQLFNLIIKYINGCYCYHKGTYFQANHNPYCLKRIHDFVVIATTKVRIFKQITTHPNSTLPCIKLLLLPQRYVFSSKSQLFFSLINKYQLLLLPQRYVFSSKSQPSFLCLLLVGVVIATTKVRIFKQITTIKKATRRKC